MPNGRKREESSSGVQGHPLESRCGGRGAQSSAVGCRQIKAGLGQHTATTPAFLFTATRPKPQHASGHAESSRDIWASPGHLLVLIKKLLYKKKAGIGRLATSSFLSCSRQD